MYKKALFLSMLGASLVSGQALNAATVSLDLEAGGSLAYTFFKGSIKPPESYTTTSPAGFSIKPDKHYEDTYFGVFGGFVVNMSDWYVNTRYNFYFTEDKKHSNSGVKVEMSPVRLSAVVGKSVYKQKQMKVNLGAGAVTQSLNKGEFKDNNPGPGFTAGSQRSHALDGSTRTDALVEGQFLYALNRDTNLKATLGYQVPTHSRTSNGVLLANLGFTYNVLS